MVINRTSVVNKNLLQYLRMHGAVVELTDISIGSLIRRPDQADKNQMSLRFGPILEKMRVVRLSFIYSTNAGISYFYAITKVFKKKYRSSLVYALAYPMTPQASLAPELPVFSDSSFPPRPRSSGIA